MAGLIDDFSGVGPAPPDSWEVADLDATMSRLMLSSKRDNNSNSDLTTPTSSPPSFFGASFSFLNSVRSSSGGVLALSNHAQIPIRSFSFLNQIHGMSVSSLLNSSTTLKFLNFGFNQREEI